MRDSWVKRRLVAIYDVLYEMRRIFVLRTMYRLKIMSPEKTLRYIAKNKCSIARFGDGEFDCIMRTRDIAFQTGSKELQNKLVSALKVKDKRLLLCVPGCLNKLWNCNQEAMTFWNEWGKRQNHQQKVIDLIRNYSGKKYLFGDSQITRPYIDWKNSRRAKRTFPMLKSLWEGRDILIVEGEKTRLGIGNDLFDNAKSLKRILAPAINAFEQYDKIKSSIIRLHKKELVLIALGPTATVLAAELALIDIQTLDIGHIDIEYEWYIRGVKEKVAIPGKFTNEVRSGRNVSDCSDKIYLSQIVERIGC